MSEMTVLHTLTRFEALSDPFTSEHASRLVPLALTTAQHFHLSHERLYLLSIAARLHDIGKVAIPRSILQKNAPLTEAEWMTMRTHPELGSTVLHEAGGIFARIAPIVLAHHERWDGGGYPYGLGGHTIPLEARIISVVDSFDAMRNQRCYRLPLSLSQTQAELTNGADQQFDPSVVRAFLHSYMSGMSGKSALSS